MWRRIRAVGRLDRVVDDHRHAVLELHLAAGHDLRTGIDALQNSDLVAARRTRSDEHLLGDELRVAFVILLLRRPDHVDRTAVGIVRERGLRQREVALLFAGVDLDVREHAGQQLPTCIRHSGFDLYVAGIRVHPRIDGVDLSLERRVLVRIGQDRDFLTDADLRQLLLREIEIDVNGIDALQCDKPVAGVEVLAGIDRGNPELARERCPDFRVTEQGRRPPAVGAGHVQLGAGGGHVGPELVEAGGTFPLGRPRREDLGLDLVAGRLGGLELFARLVPHLFVNHLAPGQPVDPRKLQPVALVVGRGAGAAGLGLADGGCRGRQVGFANLDRLLRLRDLRLGLPH